MTIKVSRWYFLVIILVFALGSMYGCGSSNRGQANVLTTVPPSSDGNLQATITSVTIGSPPVVTFTLFDETGSPLEPNAFVQAGGTLRFTIARIGADGNYKNYIKSSTAGQPGFDSGGTFATISSGLYTYTFKTDIKDPTKSLGGLVFDPTLTHTVAAQIQRNQTSLVGEAFQQAVNPYLTFRPDGGTVTVTREVVAISNCNECHGKLGAHGGGRRDVALCVLCHNPGVIDPDTGNPIDFKFLIHKLHMGQTLPSNVAGGEFGIIGFQNAVSSFKSIRYPFMSGDPITFHTLIECTKCHRQGNDLSGNAFGKDVSKYKLAPTMAKCTTCHDLTTFDGSTNITVKKIATPITVAATPHSGGPQANDNGCSGCHFTTLGNDEFNASIPGSHTVVEKSSLFTGINFQIVSVTNAVAGKAPTVTFKITDNAGNSLNPAVSTSSFNIKCGYFPVVDYTNDGMENFGQPLTQSLAAASSNGDGTYTATFAKSIPTSATGVGVIGLEGRATYTIPTNAFTAHKTTKAIRIGGTAVQYYFALSTGAQVTDPAKQRRKVVDVNKCNGCHSRLSLHGANRVNNPQECVICHNPNGTDNGHRAQGDPLVEQSIHFKVMIHKIHTGDNLELSVPYIVSTNRFDDIRYPRDRKDCLGCHVDATSFGVPLPAGALGTTTSTGTDLNNATKDDNARMAPITAACTACHDDSAVTGVHVPVSGRGADLNPSGTPCTVCHTSGLTLGPDFAHRNIRPSPPPD